MSVPKRNIANVEYLPLKVVHVDGNSVVHREEIIKMAALPSTVKVTVSSTLCQGEENIRIETLTSTVKTPVSSTLDCYCEDASKFNTLPPKVKTTVGLQLGAKLQ